MEGMLIRYSKWHIADAHSTYIYNTSCKVIQGKGSIRQGGRGKCDAVRAMATARNRGLEVVLDHLPSHCR